MTSVPLDALPVDVPDESDGAHLAVRTVGLTKMYGALVALDDLALEVPRGSIFGLIGPNGAGKTTTLAILAALLAPTSGTARVAGALTEREPGLVRRRVGYMPDTLGVYDNLTVEEYLQFFAGAYRLPVATWPGLIDGLLDLVDLRVKRTELVDALSRGMKQRLSLARALVHDPEVLILDEPASGLDPRARIDLRVLLNELRQMGKTVLISSHILAELEEICTEVAIMDGGRLIASGTPSGILQGLEQTRTVEVVLVGGERLEFSVADETEQASLLQRLVAEGKQIVEFRQTGGGLEQLFLALIKEPGE